jgi:hypothetical protein
LSKRVKIGRVSITGLAEVFNLFNHANFGGFNGQVDSASFGAVTAIAGNAYAPRSGQLGFRFDF